VVAVPQLERVILVGGLVLSEAQAYALLRALSALLD
jgi:hypothetical protein